MKYNIFHGGYRVLEIKGLSKSYADVDVFDGVSICFEEKGIYGILGGRGSGKTTLARLICGCENADGGEVLLDGNALSRKSRELKKKVRLVPTSLVLDDMTTAVEYLDFVGQTMGVEANKRYRQIKEALELCGLDECQDRPFGALVKSQKTRLSLAASLIGNPDVIVLDAPVGGVGGTELGEILSMLASRKTVILFSSKPTEVKELCSSVAILHDGKIAVSGTVDDIERRLNAEQQMFITVRGDKEKVCAAVRGVENVIDIKLDKAEVNNVCTYAVEHTGDDKIKDKIFAALSDIGAPMLSVRAVKLTFEDVFYSLSASDRGGDRK